MKRIWLKNSRTGEVMGTRSDKEARNLLKTGGSNKSNWTRITTRKDSSLYVEPKKTKKKEKKK